jgi:hypothetical protein
MNVLDVFINLRSDVLMDRRNVFKISNDGELSGSSKRQRVEGHSSGGFTSGEAGRRHILFNDTTLNHSQFHEIHENILFEVPALPQGGIEDLLGLRNQLQDTQNRSQAVLEQQPKVLECLDQQIAKIQHSSEMLASASHSGYHQQDTRPLENSFHPLARKEQSMLQYQQEGNFDINDYLNLSSDSDHESDQRDFLEAHGPAKSTPAQSSIVCDTGLHDTNSPSDAQSLQASGRVECFPLDTCVRETGQINYCLYDGFLFPLEENHLMGTTNFLTSQEYKNYQSGIKKRSDKRTPQEDLAVQIHHRIEFEMIRFIQSNIQRGKFSMKPHERQGFVLNLYSGNRFLVEIKDLEDYLKIVRQDPRYKAIYGSEEENWRSDQTMAAAHVSSPFEAQKADPSRQAFDHLGVDSDVKFHEHPDQTQDTSSQSLPEIQQSFAVHYPTEPSRSQQADAREQDQIEQIQNALMQQHEVQSQAGQSDHLKRNAEEIMQIQKSYREHKEMQGLYENEYIAQSFLNSLPDKYKQELMIYCTTGVGSNDAKQIYRRWRELYGDN